MEIVLQWGRTCWTEQSRGDAVSAAGESHLPGRLVDLHAMLDAVHCPDAAYARRSSDWRRCERQGARR